MSIRWQTWLKPDRILPVVLAAALLMTAISLGDLGQVVARVKAVPIGNMACVLLLAVLYLLLKGVQLQRLLTRLGAHPGWRRLVLSFAVGELALTLPLGVFAQNWVLASRSNIRFGRSSAATLVMLMLEVVVTLAWLAVNGVPGWPPLQPVAAALLIAMLLTGFLLVRFHLLHRLSGVIRHHRIHRLLAEGMGLLDGLSSLGQWRVLGLNLVITIAYLATLAAAFQIMGHGMGLPALDYAQAATIYAFALVSVLISGSLFGQVGTIEIIGMTAAHAWGFDYTDGLALMLGFRLAWTGAMWLLNGLLVVLLWRSVPLSTDDGKKP